MAQRHQNLILLPVPVAPSFGAGAPARDIAGCSQRSNGPARTTLAAKQSPRRHLDAALCSGGRHTYLAACTLKGIDAAVDCWGGNVVVDNPKDLNEKRPVAPIDLTEKMSCPLLGIFGNDDANPTADQVNRTEAVLKKFGKTYEFHRYNGAGHAFFNWQRDAYRPEQAMDGWRKVFDFFNRYLASSASNIAAE